MSDTRKYRKFTAQQKTEIVLASLRGPKSLAELCREHEIADSLLRKWREQFLAAGSRERSARTAVRGVRTLRHSRRSRAQDAKEHDSANSNL